MITIPVALDCPLPPERVLHAAHDFSRRRAQIWPAVREQHFAVHQLGQTSADVTEGTPTGIGINWERCRYDWSEAGRVSASVTDSNVYAHPGSSWQITATPADDGGSHVVMTWNRKFRRTPRGLIFGSLFATVGRPIFRSYGRETLANLLTVEGPTTKLMPEPRAHDGL